MNMTKEILLAHGIDTEKIKQMIIEAANGRLLEAVKECPEHR